VFMLGQCSDVALLLRTLTTSSFDLDSVVCDL
jgi:hypothetical protein